MSTLSFYVQNVRVFLEQVHEKKRPFSCNICNEVSFTSKHYLTKHIKVKHEGYQNEKKFECSECGNHFSSQNYLNTHIGKSNY